MRKTPRQERVSEAPQQRRGRGAPLRCAVPGCKVGTVGDECMCRAHWQGLPWEMRNAAGAGWRAPAKPSPGWLRDALEALGAPMASVSAGEALSPAEQRFRPKALKILATYEYLRPDFATCKGGQHPCPWVSCPSHLYLERTEAGTLHFNHPGKEFDELEETCAEDVIRKARAHFPEQDCGVSTVKAGKLVGIKRGRVGQMERKWKRAWKRVLSDRPE